MKKWVGITTERITVALAILPSKHRGDWIEDPMCNSSRLPSFNRLADVPEFQLNKIAFAIGPGNR
jgi:hypothetical protein